MNCHPFPEEQLDQSSRQSHPPDCHDKALERGKAGDMGFPSPYCEYALLTLVNKEATLAYDRTEYR